MSLYNELKRRNVFRVGIAYAITAWLIAQIAGLAADSFGAPAWVMKMIITMLMLGTPIALVLAWAYELTPGGLRRESDIDPGQSREQANASKLDRTITIALILAVAYFSYDKFVLDPRRDTALLESATRQAAEVIPKADPVAPVPAPVDQTPSIAVLSFVNMSDDAGNEYFSDGLSEELLNLLVKIPELRVAARTSSFSYKGTGTKIAQIGEDLNVTHVLEGSVRKSGNQIRITAQLIKADDSFHLWSQTYDRTLDNIFQIQDEIAAAVVNGLKITLMGAMPAPRETDPEVYSLYLQGKYFNNLGDIESLEKAVTAFKHALSIDPNYAPAWVAINISYHFLTRYGEITQAQGSVLAMDSVQHALAADPNYAFAWSSLGYLKRTYEWDWVGAEEAINKAVLLDPNNSDVMGSAASVATSLGQMFRAIGLYERIHALDPLKLDTIRALGSAYMKVGRFEEATKKFEQLLVIHPRYPRAHLDLAEAYLLKGEFEQALAEADKSPPSDLNGFVRARIFSKQGRKAETQLLINQLLETTANKYPVSMAGLYAENGNLDAAFEWLEIAYQKRLADLYYILSNTWLNNLHSDPRYLAFLEKMGLLEFWKAMLPEYGGPTDPSG